MLLLDLMRMVGPGDGAGAGVLLILKIVRKGPIVRSVETGGCCLAIYFLYRSFSHLFPSFLTHGSI